MGEEEARDAVGECCCCWCGVESWVFDFGVESLWDADGWAKALAGIGGGGTG